MVQAGVNPFPAGPGFTAAPTLNPTDGNLPVNVTVKNESLVPSLKSEPNVNMTPTISVTQVNVCSNLLDVRVGESFIMRRIKC